MILQVALHENPDRPSDALRFLKASFAGDDALLKQVDDARAELEAAQAELKEAKVCLQTNATRE